jgi:retinol dehydrogenase-12
VFFVRALNARLGAHAPIIVTASNPGLCHSELSRNTGGLVGVIFAIVKRLLAFTTEQGSRQFVFNAIGHAENPDALRGQYVNQSVIEEPSDFVISAEGLKAQDRIWVRHSPLFAVFNQLTVEQDELVETLGKVDPRVRTTVDKYLSPAA